MIIAEVGCIQRWTIPANIGIQAFTYSKLTIETLEQSVKYANGVVLVSLLLTLNIFHTLQLPAE